MFRNRNNGNSITSENVKNELVDDENIQKKIDFENALKNVMKNQVTNATDFSHLSGKKIDSVSTQYSDAAIQEHQNALRAKYKAIDKEFAVMKKKEEEKASSNSNWVLLFVGLIWLAVVLGLVYIVYISFQRQTYNAPTLQI